MYIQFSHRKFVWILVAFVYPRVILSAMQVGLAFEQLQSIAHFDRASHGVTVTAFFATAAALTVMLLLGLELFV